MATSIESFLLSSSSAGGSFAALKWILGLLSPTQIAAINPAVLSQTLFNIVHAPKTTPDGVAEVVRTLMSKAGANMDPAVIADVMVMLAEENKFAALDAVTDYLTADQKALIPTDGVSRALHELVWISPNEALVDPTVQANAIRDLMSKLGANMDPAVIADVMVMLAEENKFAALDAVTDYLTADQKALIPTDGVSRALHELVWISPNEALVDPTVQANAIRDLMSKLGANMDPAVIADVMVMLAEENKFAALDAVTDYLTADQKALIPTDGVSRALHELVWISPNEALVDPTVQANAIRDLMSKLGANMDPAVIADVMVMLAEENKFAALDAVTDYLTADQKALIPTDGVSRALHELVWISPNEALVDPTVQANAIRDLMSKLGANMDPAVIADVMVMLAEENKFAALDAVTDYLTADQKALIPTDGVSRALHELVWISPNEALVDPTVQANAIRDLMSKLGANMDPAVIADVMVMLAEENKFAALDAVTDYLTADQKLQMYNDPNGSNLIDKTLHHLVNKYGWETPITDTEQVAAVRNFMSKLGSYVSPESLQLEFLFGKSSDIKLIDAITDYLSVEQKKALSTNDFIGLGSTAAEYLLSTSSLMGINGNAREAAAYAHDLMTKFGTYVFGHIEPSGVKHEDIVSPMSNFLIARNMAGVDAFWDNLTDAQATELKSTINSDLKLLGVNSLSSYGIALGSSTAESLTGSAKDDVIMALGGRDTVRGGLGNDQIFGDRGSDLLYGDDGADYLSGGYDNDTLYGGVGNDILQGGLGIDTLWGGTGSDVFLFDQSGWQNQDRVKDFNRAEGDKLDLSLLVDIVDPTTQSITDFVSARTVTVNTTTIVNGVTTTTSRLDTVVSVDLDGKDTQFGRSDVTYLENISISLNDLINGGHVIV